MKKDDLIKKRIEEDKEFRHGIYSLSFYDTDRFISDAKQYIEAIRQGRMAVTIPHVSRSGMSRDMRFYAVQRVGRNRYSYRQFRVFLEAMGWEQAKNDRDSIKVGGCGMNMVFHVNYTNMHRLERLGFINKKQRERLAQETPTVL